MTTPWFSHSRKHRPDIRTNPGAPELIILDTANIVRPLDRSLRTYPTMNWEIEEVFQFILSAITYENRARDELEYGCLDLVRELNSTDLAHDVQVAVSDVVKLGRELIEQLKQIRAYHNGYLYYGFHSLMGGDLVLARLFLDKNVDERTPYRR